LYGITKNTQIAETILGKMSKAEDIPLPDFKIFSSAIVIKSVVFATKDSE
jgi:hypothetical protein